MGSSDTLVRVAKTSKHTEIIESWGCVKEDIDGRLVINSFGWEKIKEVDNSLKGVRPVGK